MGQILTEFTVQPVMAVEVRISMAEAWQNYNLPIFLYDDEMDQYDVVWILFCLLFVSVCWMYSLTAGGVAYIRKQGDILQA